MGTTKLSDKQKAARKRQLLLKKTGARPSSRLKKLEEVVGIWKERKDIDPMIVREEAWNRK